VECFRHRDFGIPVTVIVAECENRQRKGGAMSSSSLSSPSSPERAEIKLGFRFQVFHANLNCLVLADFKFLFQIRNEIGLGENESRRPKFSRVIHKRNDFPEFFWELNSAVLFIRLSKHRTIEDAELLIVLLAL